MQKILEVVEPGRVRRASVTLSRPDAALRDVSQSLTVNSLNIAIVVAGGNFDAPITWTPPPS